MERRYNPSTFNPQTLMPPAPQAPQCNVPGTQSTITYVQSVPAGALPPIGILQYGTNNGVVQIMGSGNTDFCAVGSGPSISGNHVQGLALSGSQYDGCGGSYIFDDVAPGTAGYSTANIQFTCNGFGGQQDVTINFVMNGQTIPNCILVRKDSNSPWKGVV
ncbi:hypothetical protein B0H11DRAFT_2371592 [Mycena galericulata]|nr:hypothetical protein B0H11DRAFT_2371592 [Mycena galericulata]